MRKIKGDDEIIVIAGRDKGKRGKVTRKSWQADESTDCLRRATSIKKHQKAEPANEVWQGGIVEKEAAIQVSNVAIFNGAASKADRVGFKVLEDGKKIRVFKSNGEAVDA